MSPKEQNSEPKIVQILTIDVAGYSSFLLNEPFDLIRERQRRVPEDKI